MGSKEGECIYIFQYTHFVVHFFFAAKILPMGWLLFSCVVGMYGMTGYKTQPCKNVVEEGFCRYGNSCQFAHSRAEMEMAGAGGGVGGGGTATAMNQVSNTTLYQSCGVKVKIIFWCRSRAVNTYLFNTPSKQILSFYLELLFFQNSSGAGREPALSGKFKVVLCTKFDKNLCSKETKPHGLVTTVTVKCKIMPVLWSQSSHFIFSRTCG